MKSDASHDPSGKSTGKEVIVKVTNTVSRKVREQRQNDKACCADIGEFCPKLHIARSKIMCPKIFTREKHVPISER